MNLLTQPPAVVAKNFPTLATPFLAIIERMKISRAQKTASEKAAKADQAVLLGAMNGAPVAFCGHYVLSAREVAASSATLTLADGTKVPWSSIKTLVLEGGLRVNAADVLTLFGGRDGYVSLDVKP